MIPAPFEYRSPVTQEELLTLLVKHGESACILAGGQSLIPDLKLRRARPGVVVDLRRIPGLRSMEATEHGVRIGALVTYRDVEESPLVRARCPILGEVASLVGDIQVRNLGTVVGGICQADPGADLSAVLLVLEAEVEIVGPGGIKVARLQDFIQGRMERALEPDEFVLALRLTGSGSAGCAYVKQSRSDGFAVAGAAARVDLEGKRIRRAFLSLTGVATRPFRAVRAEEALIGVEPGPGAVSAAVRGIAEGVEILEDAQASPEYRAYLAEVYAGRAIRAAAQRALAFST